MKRKVIIWGSLKIHQSLCSSLLGMFLRRDVYTSSTEFHTNQSSWSNSRQIFPDKALPIENFQTELHHLLRAFQEQLDWLYVKFLSLLQQQTRKVFCSQLTRVWRHLLGGTGGESVNSIQLSPKGEVNSGGDLPRREALRYITSTVHWPWGDSCFSIYQISWIKLKKVTFCKLKTPLSRNFVHSLQTFWGFVKCILQFCCKFSRKVIFLPTSKTLTSQKSSLSWYLFVRLLYLSHKFCLPKMSRNGTPSWLRAQNSE